MARIHTQTHTHGENPQISSPKVSLLVCLPFELPYGTPGMHPEAFLPPPWADKSVPPFPSFPSIPLTSDVLH